MHVAKMQSIGIAWPLLPNPGSLTTLSGGTKRASADDFLIREELSDLLFRGFRCVGTVYRIFSDRERMHLADRAFGRFRRIGRAHYLAILRDGLVALEHLHDHRAGRHELYELAVKWALLMNFVEFFGLLPAHTNAPLRDDAQARCFDHGIDRT